MKVCTSMMLCCIAVMFSCSPAKQVTKQSDDIEVLKQKFKEQEQKTAAKAVADWIEKNPCIPPEIDLDSFCDAINTHDTIYRKGDTVFIIKEQKSVKRIIVPVADKRAENLFKDSLIVIRLRLAECNAKASGRAEINPCPKYDRWNIRSWWFFIALGFFLSWVAFIIIKIFTK